MASQFTFLQRIKDRPALFAFLWVATFIAVLFIAFNPHWETNDDAAMSMIAHGYGIAAYGSPQLIFSNVLWGYLVRAIPSINGVLGYSLATLAILLVVGWATLYFLLRLGAGYLLSMFAVTVIILRPALFPQFTVNAGLLTVAAVIGWQVHARFGGTGNLVAACLLAFCGYLIRNQEFLLVLGVALPLLPWRVLRQQRKMQIAFILLGAAMVSAAVFDGLSYNGPGWQHFKELNSARIPFTDYGASWYLEQHPEIFDHYHYSQNDADLVSDWFFVDPQIANPKSLNAMLAELGPLSMQEGNIESGMMAMEMPFDIVLLPLFLSGILLLVLKPGWPVLFSWIFCLAAIFVIGVMGRPGILRVYVPLMSLLLAAPLIFGQVQYKIRRWIAVLTLCATCAGNAYLVMPDAWAAKQWTQQVQNDMQGLPVGPIVSWGENFQFESAFPVLANDPDTRKIRFYGLDSLTPAPFSVASAEQQAGRGMLEKLRTTSGIPIIASPERIEMLRIYCGEHLNGQLHSIIAYQTPSLTVQQIQCEASQ